MTHIPGHVGTADGGDDGGTLQQGQILTGANGERFIAVNTGFGWRLVPEGERTTATSGIKLPPTSVWATETGSIIEVSGSGQIIGGRAIPASQFFGTGGGGAGRAPPAFSSTQAAQAQAEEAAKAAAAQAAKVAAEAARAREAFEEEQAEIDRELRLRESRLSTARDLVSIRSAESREARRLGTEVSGEDLFTFLAVARGLQPPTGTTPAAAFKQNLQGAAQFQTPDLTGLDSNALQSVIGKLSQSLTPQGTGLFGFAHGGTVTPGGTATPTGGSQAIRVGEAGPEILILRPDGSVEVVPEVGSAQTGGVFAPETTHPFGLNTVFQALLGRPTAFGSQIREAFDVPTDFLRGIGFNRFSKIVGGGVPAKFGSQLRAGPQLLRDLLSPQPEFDLGGLAPLFERLRGSLGGTGRSAFGFLPEGVEQETSAPFQAFAGPVLNIQQGLLEAFQFQGVANPQAEAQKFSALIGQLPAPFKIPPSFFRSLLPAEQSALVSAYRFAGVPEEDFRHLLTVGQLPFSPQRAVAVG